MADSKHIIVIGAGIVGLTTALRIVELGYEVTILAEVLPTDPKTIKYTSHWAGAHHMTDAAVDDDFQQGIDQETFRVMWDQSAPGGEAEGCFLRVPQTEYDAEEFTGTKHPRGWMPDFKFLGVSDLPPRSKSGYSLTTLTIDTPKYLNFLLSRFLSLGGTVVRASIQHVIQVAEGGSGVFLGHKIASPDAIVVCAGIGARSLGGIEDKDVHPIRGQTILVRAPWIRFGRSLGSESGLRTYIIPRRSGDVILGGTKTHDDWIPKPRPETTEDILRRALAMCPELVPPQVRVTKKDLSIDDIRPIIIEEGCGLRPGRTGGPRIDVSWLDIKGNRMPIVSNYGHAGTGYQSSWGSATIAAKILEDSLKKPRVAEKL